MAFDSVSRTYGIRSVGVYVFPRFLEQLLDLLTESLTTTITKMAMRTRMMIYSVIPCPLSSL
ncbi:MAG: hypothetical protein MZV63_63410 [Marinilabiliales bacterium]|nr:hypothetical protein [Marinilabiliales bacterium]